MANITLVAASAAMPELQELVTLLGPQLLELCAVAAAFRREAVTPERTFAFEKKTAALLREAARVLVENEYNHIEPEQLQDCPLRWCLARQEYRRRPKSRNRIGTLFGEIELRRYLYEATEPGEPCLFPLEMQLGIEADVTALEYEGFESWQDVAAFEAEYRPPLEDTWDEAMAASWLAENVTRDPDGKLVYHRGRRSAGVAHWRPRR